MTINWQEVITTIGTTLAGGAVILPAAAWLVKTIVTDRMTREVEAFKARLKTDADAEIERLKSSLHLLSIEHQVTFSKLHERRAQIIAELYKHIVEASWGAQLLVFSGYVGRSERQKEYLAAQEKIRDFYVFVETNRIYLPSRICGLLDGLVQALRTPVTAIGVYGSIEAPTPDTVSKRNQVWLDAVCAFEGTIPNARKELESEFRTILGVAADGQQTR